MPYPEPAFYLSQSSPYMFEILYKTKSISPGVEFLNYTENKDLPLKLTIVAGDDEPFPMPHETVAAKTYLIPELNQKIYLDGNDQIIGLVDNRNEFI